MRLFVLGLCVLSVGALMGCDSKKAEEASAEDVVVNDVMPECLFDNLIGQTYSEAQYKTIDGRPVRALYPDSMATMDYNPERINLHLNPDNDMILAVGCG